MQTKYTENQKLFNKLYKDYKPVATQIISFIEQDRSLSKFHTFNRRFKINLTMKIDFDEQLIGINNPDVIYCYQMMLKLTDLWFAFEHLKKVISDLYPAPNSKFEIYSAEENEALGILKVTNQINSVYMSNIINETSDRKELHLLLVYLINHTFGGTKTMLETTKKQIKKDSPFFTESFLVIAYGLRNIYGHEGVAAALGRRDYKFKRKLYDLLYDALVLYCLSIGKNYAQQKVNNMRAAST